MNRTPTPNLNFLSGADPTPPPRPTAPRQPTPFERAVANGHKPREAVDYLAAIEAKLGEIEQRLASTERARAVPAIAIVAGVGLNLLGVLTAFSGFGHEGNGLLIPIGLYIAARGVLTVVGR